MKLHSGYLNYHSNVPSGTDVCLLFTSNKIVTANGLVMGAGNALACKKAFPDMPVLIANQMKLLPDSGVVFIPQGNVWVGCFPTKNHWKDPSDVELVKQSIRELYQVATHLPHITFCLPAPAIGRGGLPWEVIEPLVQVLPDNVIVFK